MGIEKLNVSDTIAEIVRDNAQLCRRVADKGLDKYVDAIVMWGRRARFLSFFQAFMSVRGKYPIKRSQDLILRLLLDKKAAVLDLTCDYTRSKFLSPRDERYGMTRLDLLRADDHKRPIFSLLKYHSATLKTLAMCAFGRNVVNQMKIATEVKIGTILDNILNVDLRHDGTRDNTINPDALRFVQIGWIELLSEVYFSCNDVLLVKEVAHAPQVWLSPNSVHTQSLFTLFCSTLTSFNFRMSKLEVEHFAGRREIFEGFVDEFGHDLGAHLDLVEQCMRASIAYCDRWTSYVSSNKLVLKEAQSLRDSVVHLFYLFEKLQLSDLSRCCIELITRMSGVGIDGVRLNVTEAVVTSTVAIPDHLQAMLQGWPKFRQYLSLVLANDVPPSQLSFYHQGQSDGGMAKSIQDIALALGSTRAHANDHLQSLREFCQVIARPECDDFLRLTGMKALRAIIYMRPDQEDVTRAKLDAEFQLFLDNKPCSDIDSSEHERWQARIAHIGAVDVVCTSFLSENLEICTAALQLAISLLDGGNPEAQSLFTARMLPSSSAPFFTKLHQLFADSREELRESKRRAKQAAAENAALQKAGIRANKRDMEVPEGAQDGQQHMKEAIDMMKLMCNGDSVLDDVLRHQALNHESYNFFVQTELYLEAIEHELRNAVLGGKFEMVEVAISGFEFMSAGKARTLSS